MTGSSGEARLDSNDIGPGTVLWKNAGDYRSFLTVPSAALLQLMHPDLGAGVSEHSNVFDDVWNRFFRSAPWILGAIYDEDPAATGHMVRDFHRSIKGVKTNGEPYHALHPETFWWGHATFVRSTEEAIHRYGQGLSRSQQEAYYQQTNAWYENYGVTLRPMPKNYKAFDEKCRYIYDEVLEMTPAAERLKDMIVNGEIHSIPNVPQSVWRFGHLPVNEVVRLVTIGSLPNEVRDRFDIHWSGADELKLKLFEQTIKTAWPLNRVEQMRYHPRALAGIRRERAAHTAHMLKSLSLGLRTEASTTS
jgi:uncharacterized protein (DUF2236 family)